MNNRNLSFRPSARMAAIALFLGVNLLGQAVQAAEPAGDTTVQQPSPALPEAREASLAETDAYAAREQQASAALAGFQGGDTTVIIGGTTLVIVILVILIIVLI